MGKIKEVFGRNLRALRGAATQAEMAERLKLPLRNYQRLEAGEQYPRDSTLSTVSDILGVEESSLFQAELPEKLGPDIGSLLSGLSRIRPDLLVRIVALDNIEIERALDFPQNLLARLAAVDDRERAAAFEGLDLELPPLPEARKQNQNPV